MAAKKKPKTGRPLAKIDPSQVEQLAAIQCSYAEMAAVLGCDPKTLSNRFSQAIEKGREVGKSSLKRAQFKLAMGGNATMLIWLGKQHLEQQDSRQSVDVTVRPGTGVLAVPVTDANSWAAAAKIQQTGLAQRIPVIDPATAS